LLSVYRDYGVVLKASRDDNHNRASDDLDPYQLVEPGQLVTNKMKTWQGSIAVSELRGIVSPAYFVYEPIRNVIGRFIHHLMRCRPYIIGYMSVSKGIRVGQWDLDPDHFRTFPVLFPPKEEQEWIVKALDRETARIDALISKKTEFIELLAKKRQALITHAVTKGLNPDVRMKDSGVEWIGEVPEHWSVQPIKYLACIGNGSTPNKDNGKYWENGTFPWLTSGCVNLDEVICAEQYVTEAALIECHLPIIAPPAVLVGITGQGKTRGMATTLKIEATINQHIAFLKPISKNIHIGFLRSFLEAAYNWLRFDSEGVGSTKGAITCEQLANTRIAMPPLAEQQSILAFIDRQSDRTARLQSKTQLSIDLLRKRRSALITAAVTGQIDLRESV
jgi:type I restriction enzyme S subunit